MFFAVNPLAILVAAIAAWIVGGVWYGLLGKHWVEAQGFTMETFKEKQAAIKGTPASWLPFVVVFVADLIIAWILSGIMAHIGAFSVRGGLISAAFVWFGFVLTTLVSNYAFNHRGVRLMAIDAGAWLFAFLVIGAVLGAWGA